jgi:hypothetical protein
MDTGVRQSKAERKMGNTRGINKNSKQKEER